MESPKIITLYSNHNEQIQVKWDSVTGKIKVEPETEWLYPEGVDERVELCLALCKNIPTPMLQALVESGGTLEPGFGQILVSGAFKESND